MMNPMALPLHGKKILVVDDEELLRDLLRSVFSGEGAEVTVAESGVKALALYVQQKFDAVITDVRMPGGDGLTLIEKIRQQPGSKLPLMFLCSGFNDLAADTASRLGIARVFEKPFNLRDMIEDVRLRLG
jgi:CheY-like chemotaxis protein